MKVSCSWWGGLLLLLWLSSAAGAAEVPESGDLAADGRLARSLGVPLLVVFSAEHCGYCELLEAEILRPMILSGEGEVVDEEGCLSIPDVRGKVARRQKVVVQAQGLDGKVFTEEIEDLDARVVQHELDHLDGILFISRPSATDQPPIKSQLKKLASEAR